MVSGMASGAGQVCDLGTIEPYTQGRNYFAEPSTSVQKDLNSVLGS